VPDAQLVQDSVASMWSSAGEGKPAATGFENRGTC
jgi:hypothetical protein